MANGLGTDEMDRLAAKLGSRGKWRRFTNFPIVGTAIIAVTLLFAIGAENITPYDPHLQDLNIFLQPPSFDHIMGTDALGRDIFSRVIYGARVTVLVGLASIALAGVVGVLLGIASVVLPPLAGEVIMRVADIVLTLPAVLIALAAAATVGPSLPNLIIIIGSLYWAHFARMVRAETLTLREIEYIQAAEGIGCSSARIIFRHLVPNLANTVIVIATLQIAAAVLLESTLSFLGVGVPPPLVTWGTMVSEARPYFAVAWWTGALPGLAIMLVVLAINMLGDTIRDRLDPQLRRR